MRKRMRMTLGAAGMALLCCAGAGMTAMSEETEISAPETITVTVEGQEAVEIANTAQLAVTAVSAETQEDESLVRITMAAGDGQQYEFEDVPLEALGDPELVEDGAFAYIQYTSLTSGKERRIGQTGELTYSEPAELFAVDDVYIRSEPDDEAEILGVISRGDAIEVLGETAAYYKVKKDDVSGYTVRKCISEDEQEAIAAVQAEEAAREQIRLAQEAAAAAAAQQQASSGGGSGVTEVRRQKFDDCDGSGHGYYLITYSDGSTATEEY